MIHRSLQSTNVKYLGKFHKMEYVVTKTLAERYYQPIVPTRKGSHISPVRFKSVTGMCAWVARSKEINHQRMLVAKGISA